MDAVRVASEDGIGTLILHHGTVNPLGKDVIAALCAALEQLVASVRVVILRAPPGARVFSAGHDIRELPTNGRDPLTYTDPVRQIVRTIQRYPHPVLAMIEGSVWGGAVELVLSCDLIIAASDVTFALTPAKLGVPYDLAGILNVMNGAALHVLKEMLFTAQPVPAARLAACGMINHVVPREQLETVTREVARHIAAQAPLVHRILKEELRALAGAHRLNPEAYERLQALRRDVYDSADYQEGIRAFLEKRAPHFQGR